MRNTVPWTYFKAPFRWQFLLAVIHFPVQMIPSVYLLTAHLSSKGPSFATFASGSFRSDVLHPRDTGGTTFSSGYLHGASWRPCLRTVRGMSVVLT